MKVKNYIFITGCGRSGTTLLYDILSRHHKLGWFSQWNNSFPNIPYFAFLSRIRDLKLFNSLTINPIKNKSLLNRVLPKAIEADILWAFLYQKNLNFSRQSLTKKDVRKINKDMINNYIYKILYYQGKERFISKNTSHTNKILFLDELFSDSYFIHIVRDPRAVINSLIQIGWDNLEIWWTDFIMTPKKWQKKEFNLAKLWSITWKKENHIFLKDKDQLKGKPMIIFYEELTERPFETIQKILNFCNLEFTDEIVRYLKFIKPDNRNYKWKKGLIYNDLKTIYNEAGDLMAYFNYKIE